MAIKKSQLYATLWDSCNALRGTMDASQYKNYVLIMLFAKYLSDKEQQGEIELEVPDGCHFSDFIALKQNEHIGEQLNIRFEKIVEANQAFLGTLKLPSFNDEANLGKGKTMVETLSKLIGVFEDSGLDFSQNRAADDDLLGDAYEYLMKKFSVESGKSKGQFYTPAEVSRVIARLLHLDDLTRGSQTIYDPTCGSGSLLLRALAETPNQAPTLYGQDLDQGVAALAKLNMLLHGIISAEIEVGDTLNDPQFKKGGMLQTFDVCIANPHFSKKGWLTQGGEADKYHRWSAHLLPPKKCGDYAFLMHLIASMRPDTGRGACILPHGVLFRGHAEKAIRQDIVDRHFIKGIIGLPPKLFFGTGIPASILVIDKRDAASRKGIFFIDAKEGYRKDGNMNRLREQDILRIIDAWDDHLDIPHYARLATWDEIRANDYNLNIPRYITPRDTEVHHDIHCHLAGGLPEADILAMQETWAHCPTLKDALFCQKEGKWQLAVEPDSVLPTILHDPSFKANIERHTEAFLRWANDTEGQMLAIGPNCNPKLLIKAWGKSLFQYIEAAHAIIDPYTDYDILLNYWADTMQDDCYMVSNDGWTIPLPLTFATTEKGKVKTNYTDILCDLLPYDVVVSAHFAQEQSQVDSAEQSLDEAKQAIDEHTEQYADTFDTFEKLNDKAVKAAMKQNYDPDDLAALRRYLTLTAARKKAKDHHATLCKALTQKVVDYYAALTPEQVAADVVRHKWMPALLSSIRREQDAQAQKIAATVADLARRYEHTLPELQTDVEQHDNEVKHFLQQMGYKA